jgi:hypothetical protein
MLFGVTVLLYFTVYCSLAVYIYTYELNKTLTYARCTLGVGCIRCDAHAAGMD